MLSNKPKIKVPVDDPRFYEYSFTWACRQRSRQAAEKIEGICLEEYNELSLRVASSQLQDSCSVRNVLRTRSLARIIIDDRGELRPELLQETIQHLQASLYSFGPNRQYEGRRQEHILKILCLLRDHKDLAALLKNIAKPHAHKQAEDIIRDTLGLPANSVVTDAEARRAVLGAWMCYLRQNVGSCFATAPAIIVHSEQPQRFLTDMAELLATGRLKRTFGGVEYTAPLSKSWGAGDLKRHCLIQRPQDFEQSHLWLSPGLCAAFESIGLIPHNIPLKDKTALLKKNLQDMLPTLASPLVQPVDIIRLAALRHLSLTEQEIQDYEKRALTSFQPTLSAPSTGKNQTCARFNPLFETACNAFKMLADNALLKAWEFTLASFAETKADFAKWNLYSSLGLGPQDKGGIGFCIFEILKTLLEQCNRKVRELQEDCDVMYGQVKYLETRLQRSVDEKEMQWLKVDFQARLHEFRLLEELRNREHNKAQRFAQLFDVLIDEYLALFPNYFQEVYDADMHEVETGPYDDSPAGFRLIYKHGRANTAQWTYIYTPQQFISVLHEFFISTEREIAAQPELKDMEQEFSEIVSAITGLIKTNEFLESAFHRMAAAHRTAPIAKPLEHLESIEKKPWAYTSGGTMGTLVSCYFRLEHAPKEVGRWVENPMELAVFLVDSMKQIPYKVMENFEKEKRRYMLIHSPTHAFLLTPTRKLFKEAWKSETFTYTWIRDQIMKPVEYALHLMSLDREMMGTLIHRLLPKVPENVQSYFKQVFSRFPWEMSPVEFRTYLVNTMSQEIGLISGGRPVVHPDEIDSLLFSVLPLFPTHKIRERLADVLQHLPMISSEIRQSMLDLLDNLPQSRLNQPYAGSDTLQNICKALWCMAARQTSSPIDIHAAVAKAARACGYALPPPFHVADSNWITDDFGFVYNPGTGKVDFWQLDPLGISGNPLSSWKLWLDGSRKDRTWGIYNVPHEYS